MAGKKRRASCVGERFTLQHSEDPPEAKKARSRRHSVWADNPTELVSVVVLDDDEPETATLQKPVRQRRSRQGQKPDAKVDEHHALQEVHPAKKARKRLGQVREETEDGGLEVLPGKKTSGGRNRSKADVEDHHAQPKDRPAKNVRKRRSRRVDETSLISTSEDLEAEATQPEVHPVAENRGRRCPREDESDLQAVKVPAKKKARKHRDRSEEKVKEGASQSKVRAAKKARNRRDRPEAELEAGNPEDSISSKKGCTRRRTRREDDPAVQEPDAEVRDGGSKSDDNELTKSSKKTRDRRRSRREDEPPVQKPDAAIDNDGTIQSKRDRIKDSASCDRHCRRVDKALPPAAKEVNADGGRARKQARHNCSPSLTEPTKPVAKKTRDRRHRQSDVEPFPSVVVIDSDPEVQPPAKKRQSRRCPRDRSDTSSESDVEVIEVLKKRKEEPSPRLYLEISDTESESAPSSSGVPKESLELDGTCEIIEEAIELVDVEEEAEKSDLIDQIMNVVRDIYGFKKPEPEVLVKVEKEVAEAGLSASHQ